MFCTVIAVVRNILQEKMCKYLSKHEVEYLNELFLYFFGCEKV